jgi:hypothetical protein
MKRSEGTTPKKSNGKGVKSKEAIIANHIGKIKTIESFRFTADDGIGIYDAHLSCENIKSYETLEFIKNAINEKISKLT